MKKVTVSAPGKLHLAGEHAVVYGKPAIVVATSLRLYVTLDSSGGGVSVAQCRKKDAYIDAIASVFEKKYGVSTPGNIHITIGSTIPSGSGMGSSAALAVAFLGALTLWHGLPWNTQALSDIAYQAEKTKHNTSSGSDPAVATHGGILWYRKELEFLKTLWLLPFKIPKTFTPFVLINTGRKESTGDLVSYVEQVKKQSERNFSLLLHEIEEVTKNVARSIHDENEEHFRAALSTNEQLLERMGVVSAKAQVCIRDIEKAGGVAKISGAGGRRTGSGVIIASCDLPKKLTEIASSHGYPSFQVILGGEGVKIEQVRT